jgi:hypothetical protein
MPALTPILVSDIAGEVAALVHDDGSAGRYATDGIDLYRLLGPLVAPGSAEGLVAIEDCHSLDVVLVEEGELASWRMRPVLAAAV